MQKTLLLSFSLLLAIGSAPTRADDSFGGVNAANLLLTLTAAYLIQDQLHDGFRQERVLVAQRDRRLRRHSRDHRRDYNRSRIRHPGAQHRRTANNRHAHTRSYTSQPVRGGSSRRTRIIENPYSNRLVTGITLTGIDNDFVHLEDVIAYPARRQINHRDFTLSSYHPPQFINTRGHIDYISVQAKRKEYFTVTFHYD